MPQLTTPEQLVEKILQLEEEVKGLKQLLIAQTQGGSEKTLQSAIDDSQHSTRLSDFFVSGAKALPDYQVDKLALKAGDAIAMDKTGKTGLINIHIGLNGLANPGQDG